MTQKESNMNSKILVAWLVSIVIVATTAAALRGQLTTPQPQKTVPAMKPYQVISGQVGNNFQVLYVLDNDTKQLAVLKYDGVKDQLVAVVGRNLAEDFGGGNSGTFSMTTVQISNSTGLLYVTDYAAHKAIAYKVELIKGTVTPNTPVDLKALFAK